MRKRVVITGMGVSNSIARSRDEFQLSLREGRSGLKPISPDRFPTDANCYANKQACTLDQDLYESLKDEDETILSRLSMLVMQEALDDAGVDRTQVQSDRVAFCTATTIGGAYPFIRWTRRRLEGNLTPEDFELLFRCSTPTMISKLQRHFGFRGPISTISTACTSGTNSVGRAFDMIAHDRIDMALAGGVDVFTELTFSGFNSLQSLSKNICKPFDKKRDGLTLGDAAAYLVVESLDSALARGARIYAEVKGYSATNEAYHPTAPKPDGSTAYETMMHALRQGGVEVEAVEYINAHGTGTNANDSMEINGIRRLVGDRPVFISSTKSMIGHTLGAAGSVELIATVLGMHHDFIPPSCNTGEALLTDDDNIVLVRDKGLVRRFDTALSNSFGFGGCMASIVVQRFVA
ncbi:beta-ketoacyl-[acyl-carrier-protein] synthase family protein [Spirosoma validum]|uniref:Beta-ketoacyl-[acyl-carrier-protein] synthase family protein n=1 Tax=Spirosoma validum TaxID=2771355 RepID=A0A927GDT3_9BACT|nr:beta-ketoacyl-[acyl-carrier-protein] synthase family protein [Spirosoma validum]MBD2754059.1 beta-ketoacyl-[acyl-carrier-protein] synthase family protein [Spirosoma validum]